MPGSFAGSSLVLFLTRVLIVGLKAEADENDLTGSQTRAKWLYTTQVNRSQSKWSERTTLVLFQRHQFTVT